MSFSINVGRWLIGPYCGERWLSPLSWWNYRERFPFWKSSVSEPGDLFFSVGPICLSRSEDNVGHNKREREHRKYVKQNPADPWSADEDGDAPF